jgi:hypothetical protein
VNAIGVAVTKLVNEDAIFASGAFCNKIVEDAKSVVVVLAPEEGTTVSKVVVVVLAFDTLIADADDTKLAVALRAISVPTSLIISAIILPMPY